MRQRKEIRRSYNSDMSFLVADSRIHCVRRRVLNDEIVMMTFDEERYAYTGGNRGIGKRYMAWRTSVDVAIIQCAICLTTHSGAPADAQF